MRQPAHCTYAFHCQPRARLLVGYIPLGKRTHCPQHASISIEYKCGLVVLLRLQMLVFLAEVAVANREDIRLVSRWKATTGSKHTLRVASNVVARETSSPREPNQTWGRCVPLFQYSFHFSLR